jgi:hypothetical protein
MEIPTVTVAASHMKPRADAFRADFVKNYLMANRDYPVDQLLRSTSLWPVSSGSLKLLLQRGAISINDGLLSNMTGVQVEARFEPVIDDSAFDVAITVPQPFRGSATSTDTLLNIQLTTPFLVTFLSKPSLPSSDLFPDQTFLTGISLSDTALSYMFNDVDTMVPQLLLVASFETIEVLKRILAVENEFAHVEAVMRRHAAKPRLMGVGVCGGETWEPFDSTTAHCSGLRKKATNPQGYTFEYNCVCGPSSLIISVTCGNTMEADADVEQQWLDQCQMATTSLRSTPTEDRDRVRTRLIRRLTKRDHQNER